MRFHLQMIQPYIGIDIIEISRIQKAVDRWGAHFLNRIYTVAELSLCQGRSASLAARFSGKEAVIKALNPPDFTVSWKEIEILSEPGGKPLVILHGKLKSQADRLGLSRLEISLSHSRENAVAMVTGINGP
jgi:holo-[acyl-carrier protein] synthase